MMSLPNAGGSSLSSEVLSYEILARAFGARLDYTEMELRYTPGSKLTDYAATVFGERLGVSVTRALRHGATRLDAESASRLLEKKLSGIIVSSRNVQNVRFSKQLLHVLARNYHDAQLLERQYALLPEALRTNTIVLITLCHGIDWIW